ncbi:hypothetical protein FJT64_012453 [Amphibalanus amphitrite]|uniref:Uncharacterized protein n=1 Tax=Amphibalanus amphitrite TaxID=1232801 RepID=A0A6A4VCJ3_AMPAM|nr:hypothetical protein FJT64_012453 [Amphibalanus amphitrite]
MSVASGYDVISRDNQPLSAGGGALEPTDRAPRALPDWLAHLQPIGDRRPAPANLPALCPELRARLAAEGIEQVFLVQVTVLPELLAAADSPLPPADL